MFEHHEQNIFEIFFTHFTADNGSLIPSITHQLFEFVCVCVLIYQSIKVPHSLNRTHKTWITSETTEQTNERTKRNDREQEKHLMPISKRIINNRQPHATISDCLWHNKIPSQSRKEHFNTENSFMSLDTENLCASASWHKHSELKIDCRMCAYMLVCVYQCRI